MIRQTAIRVKDFVFTGRGHGSVGLLAYRNSKQEDFDKYAEYGFVNEQDMFLDRHKAYEEAFICRQIEGSKTNRNLGLFSEDLWEQLDPTERCFQFRG